MGEFKIETLPGQNERTRILRITGPLTLKTLFDFQQALRSETAAVMIVDLSAVPYLDSAGLGSLLELHGSCRRNGQRYALAGATERLETIFHITHVDKMLLRFPTVEDAEKTLQSGASGN